MTDLSALLDWLHQRKVQNNIKKQICQSIQISVLLDEMKIGMNNKLLIYYTVKGICLIVMFYLLIIINSTNLSDMISSFRENSITY